MCAITIIFCDLKVVIEKNFSKFIRKWQVNYLFKIQRIVSSYDRHQFSDDIIINKLNNLNNCSAIFAIRRMP